jgi:ribonuclease HI
MLILFVDNSKAFDSIHQTFIKDMLSLVGFPAWVRNIINALLTEVEVSPVLANDASLRIKIRRGVKQGCPLSPLLFILVNGMLISALTDLPASELAIYAAADDLAIGTPTFKGISTSMVIISEFAIVSGLGVNFDKSAILPTLPLSFNPSLLLRCPWPQVKVVNSYTHLGVLIGHNITTTQIFQKPHNKALARVDAYATPLARLPIHKRIIIVNVFIIPVYMYLGSFFIIPYTLIQEFRRKIYKVIIPLGGGGFNYIHLLSPSTKIGFQPPLKDLWGWNMTTLLVDFPFENLSESEVNRSFDSPNEIKDHILSAAIVYLEKWSHGGSAWEIALPIPTELYALKKTIYNNLIEAGYGRATRSDFSRKIKLLGIDDVNAPPTIYKNWLNLVPRNTPPFIRSKYIFFLFKSFATSTRVRFFIGQRRQAKTPENYPCPFCKEGTDDFAHFVSDCLPIREFFIQFAISQKVLENPAQFPEEHSLNFFTLNFDFSFSQNPKHLVAITISFIATLFFTRKAIIASSDLSRLDYWLNRFALDFLPKATPIKVKKKKKIEAAKRAMILISKIPKNSVIIYSDGSAYGNPGPAGAGAWILMPGIGEVSLYESLGSSTNNAGELWAIGMALDYILTSSYQTAPVYICTDSNYAIGLLRDGHKAKSNRDLIIPILAKIKALPQKITFIHVPGHADVPGNVSADSLANHGSKISRASSCPTRRYNGDSFSYARKARPDPD